MGWTQNPPGFGPWGSNPLPVLGSARYSSSIRRQTPSFPLIDMQFTGRSQDLETKYLVFDSCPTVAWIGLRKRPPGGRIRKLHDGFGFRRHGANCCGSRDDSRSVLTVAGVESVNLTKEFEELF